MIDTTDKKNFPKDWELVSFGDILKSVKREEAWDDAKLYKLLSVRRRSEGAFHREDLYGYEIKTKNLQPVKQGDFVISKMQIVHGASALITSTFNGFYVSGSYLILHAKNSAKLDLSFLAHLSSHPWFYKVCLESSYGVHIEKMTFNFNLFLKTQFLLPSFAEQQKIAEVLSVLDEKMAVIDEQLVQTQELKKGLMQRLLTKGIGHTQFKNSPLGEIPASWEVVKLSEVSKIERGKFQQRPRNDPRFFGGQYPFVQTGDVGRASGKITAYSQTLNELGLSVSRLFPAGTLVITIAANIGDVAIAQFEVAFPDSLVGIVADNLRIDNFFLMYYLVTQKEELNKLAPQSAQRNINLEILRPYKMPLPPLLEQRQIAEILTTIDDKIGVLQDKKAQYHTLKRGLMQQLLTGQRRVRVAEQVPALV